MPRPSRWVAKHKECQVAVDNVAAKHRAEIDRLKAENEQLRARVAQLEADAEVDEFTIGRLKSESIYEDDPQDGPDGIHDEFREVAI
jgi:hypothetical protein